MKKGNSIKLKIAVIISIIITIFWLLPYIYVICCSFKPGSEVIAVPPSFLPKSFSVENFTQLFVRMNAGGYLLNSLITAVCSTITAILDVGIIFRHKINTTSPTDSFAPDL